MSSSLGDRPETDTLVKPDMKAVLSRTHLARDLHGFLLPIFEAVSNAMDGIERRFGDRARDAGEVQITLLHANEPSRLKVRIIDNGVGLTDDNYKWFKTPFTGHKLHQKGRGFGRFIAFKVFSKIIYSSRYEFFTHQNFRTFRFDINNNDEIAFIDVEPDFEGPGLSVEYSHPLTEWNELIREIKAGDILDEIGSHFLPYFLYRWLPKITIRVDDDEPEDITQHFKDVFVQYDQGEFTCEIEGANEVLSYSLTRIPKSRKYPNHCLLLAAADRIVGHPRSLANKLGDSHFVDEAGGRYIVIAVVRGEAFESRLNDARTGINLNTKVVESIVDSVSSVIQNKEVGQIDRIKAEQSDDLSDALSQNPILRLGLRGRTVREYVAKKPNNWRAEQFISDLAIERYRASTDLTREITAAASSADDYEAKIKEIVSKVDAGKKEALAEYVIHRKNIIELVEAARRYANDDKRAPEDTIHDLVFRRFGDNTDTSYFEHNLWLIDDALSFLPYISSDRAMHGRGRKSGDKITDLMFFDDSLILGDEESTTLTIVEFKRPSRNDYRFGDAKYDPVKQVIDTLEKATAAGGITRTDGSHVSFGGVVRRFAFIVADLTPTLINVLRDHDFRNDINPKMFVRYRDNGKILIQAYGYETLLEMAKKRNQAFFSVLLDE